uniref:Uncharacterized protein n=1 Tax=Oryza barthii TaxID=65489 RepID=A0A0D3GGW0_9ORYZ
MWDLRAYDEQLLISARSPASGGGCFRGLKCSRRLLLDTIFFPCFSEAIVFNFALSDFFW